MAEAQGDDGLAPVIPLFGDAVAPPAEPQWRSTWDEDVVGVSADPESRSDANEAREREFARDLAERALLKRLRTRQLSEREAREVLSARDLDIAQIDALISAFRARGYVDDERLAEQLIHAGAERKGQGRAVIAQTLARRGIPRAVAEAALQALPEDDAERALEYARRKARSLRGIDRDAALRRLAGQLARRGYRGALDAARTALDERDAEEPSPS